MKTFVDEIHRLNKMQKDTFLHHIEDGRIYFDWCYNRNYFSEEFPDNCKKGYFYNPSEQGLEKK